MLPKIMPPKTTKEKKVKNDNIKLEKINDTKKDIKKDTKKDNKKDNKKDTKKDNKKDTKKDNKKDTNKDNKSKIPDNKEWIEHTKLFAKENNMKYTEAIKSDKNRIAYHGKKIIMNIDNKKVKKQFLY
jgi:hypothetical protein